MLVCDVHLDKIATRCACTEQGLVYACEACAEEKDKKTVFPVESIELCKELNYNLDELQSRLSIHQRCALFLANVRSRKDKIAEEARDLEKFVKQYQLQMTAHSTLLSGLMDRLASQIAKMSTTTAKVEDEVTRIVDVIADKIREGSLTDIPEFTRPPAVKKMVDAAKKMKDAVEVTLTNDLYLQHMEKTLNGETVSDMTEPEFIDSAEQLVRGVINGYGGYLNVHHQRHGFGVQIDASDNSTYKGQWVDNRRHGKGKIDWTDGSWYEGDWRNDHQHGLGTFHHSSGDEYIGSWSSGYKHGLGAYKFATGDLYIGEYKDNLPTGRGALFWSNGAMFVGKLMENKPSGRGLMAWPESRPILGDFRSEEGRTVVDPISG